MTERYSKLYSLPENQYTTGAPVLIAAGALLKDNQTGKALAQIKFKNISDKQIKAVKISIAAFDISGEELEGIATYQYLDLDVGRNTEFGQKQAVILPDTITRSYSVNCTDVFFADGSVWKAESNASWDMLPAQRNITEQLENLAAQYQRDTSSKSKYVPVDYEDLWLCSCGTINHDRESQCYDCRHSKVALFAALDVDILRQRDNEFNVTKAEEAEIARKDAIYDEAKSLFSARSVAYIETAIKLFQTIPGWKDTDEKVIECQQKIERIKREDEKEKKIRTKKMIIWSSVGAAIVAIIIVLYTVIIPTIDYKNANALLNNGEFIAAEEAFEALDNYKDSQTMVLECRYQSALSQIENRNYDEAYEILRGLADYKDSLEQIRNSIFQRAKDHIEHKEYEAAYSLLGNMDNNPEAQEIILEGKLQEANDYIQAGDYDRGYEILSSLGQSDKVNENIYQRAILALTEKDYDLAHTLFVSLGDYEESKTKAQETKYQKACDLLKDKNYDEANPIFEKLGNYKDSKDKIHYHDYKVTDAKAAGCTAGGYNTYYCEGCQDGHTEQIPPLGHDHKRTVTKEAACETQGIYTYMCTRCSDSYTKPIEALGHNYSGATCAKASICSRCGLQEAPALGHTTNTGVCSRCNYNFTAPLYFSGSGNGITNNYHELVLPYGTYKLTLEVKQPPRFENFWELGIDGNILHMYGFSDGTFDYFTAEIKSGGYIWIRFEGKYEITVTPVN